ncbi:hypothetical protein [Ruminiclostridium hungatei]|uniref:hypothetical protein n=1 Tax=Ruminiclostridium hungatei TaxID=48256 RepID=UPI0010546E9D|nr:hypothetical protein [Ruminiclostridium hungatei]
MQSDVKYINSGKLKKLPLVVMAMLKAPESFYSLFGVARMLGIPKATVAKFDKSNPSGVSELAPIAHLFVCFEEEGRKTWAIKKSHFDKWQRTGRVPKVSSGRPKTKPENCENWNDWIPKELATEFKRVVDNANKAAPHMKISYRQARFIAYQEFIDRRPNLK